MGFARLRLAARQSCGYGAGGARASAFARLWLAARFACLALAAGPVFAQPAELEPAPAGVEAAELAGRAAEALGGRRTYLEAVLSVREDDVAMGNEIRFRAWLERSSGRGFLRVLEPAREAGTGLLRLPPNLWRYAPRTASLELVDPDRLGEPWLGSDFTLADLLVGPTALGNDPARLLGVDPAYAMDGAENAYVLELRPEGSGAHGRVIAWIGSEHTTPLRCDRRDARDALVASLRFDELREVAGRWVPHRWRLTKPAAPNRESRIELREIRFDPVFDDEIFTTRQLLQLGGSTASGTAPDARLGAPGGSPP
jgi:Outer membrane lipoprotein-sorting protein